MCNPHTAPFPLIYPPVIGGGSLTMGAAYHLHAAPRLTSFKGFFFPASLTTTGAACNPHAAPFYFFSLPLVGGASFPRATRRRVTHTPPPFHFAPLPYYLGGVAYSPPRRWGGILSHNDGAARNPRAAPSFNFVYPPCWGGMYLF